MTSYSIAIYVDFPLMRDVCSYHGVLARYHIQANSDGEAFDLGFKRFCADNPYRSHDVEDYEIGVDPENGGLNRF